MNVPSIFGYVHFKYSPTIDHIIAVNKRNVMKFTGIYFQPLVNMAPSSNAE